MPLLSTEPVGHCATHWPTLQMPDTQAVGVKQGPPLTTRQAPLTLVCPAGHEHEFVVAFHTDPVGVEHEHVVLPYAPLLEPAPQATQPAWPVDEK